MIINNKTTIKQLIRLILRDYFVLVIYITKTSMFTYDNKTYKSLNAMKSAKTRDTKKKLLAELFKRDSDLTEINRLQNILDENKKEQKSANFNNQKARREYKKTAIGLDIDDVLPTKKTKDVRIEIRKFNQVVNEINLKDANFIEKNDRKL